MDTLNVLSDADIAILKGIVYRERNRPGNTTGRGAVPAYESDSPPTTDVYIAKVPPSGIPALTPNLLSSEGDVPGMRICNVYKIRMVSGTPRLQPVTDPAEGMTRVVYNLSLQEIAEESLPYVVIKREKFGSWLADGGGSVGTGGEGDCDCEEPPCGFLILDCPEDGPGTGTDGETVGTGTENDGVAYLCCDSFEVCIDASTPIPVTLFATVVIRDGVGGTILATFSIPIHYTDTADFHGLTRAGWFGCEERDVDTECVPVATVFLQCESGEFKVSFNGFTVGGHTLCDGYISLVGLAGTVDLVADPFSISSTGVSFTGSFASPTCGDIFVEVNISE